MKRVHLDASFASAPAVYAKLAKDLDLGPDFGNNLDALWDRLSRDVPGPFEIVWRDSTQARAQLGAAYTGFEKLFRDLEAERPDFRFRAEA